MRNFRKAISNTALFLFIIILLAIPFPIFYYEYSLKNWTATTDIVERNAYAGQITLLFSGASHGLEAFVPEIFDQELNCNSYNLCGTLHSLKGRYALLKEELSRNPVETVILELSYNSLSRSHDQESAEGELDVIRRLSTREEKLNYALDSLSLDDWGIGYYLITHNGFSAIVEAFTVDTDLALENSLARKGYLALEPNDLSLTDEEYRLQYHSESADEKIVPENMEYLNKIFELCKEKDIQVIMVTTPISQRMINRIDNLDKIRSCYALIAQEHNCNYYDFNLWKDRVAVLSDKNDFYDDYHLSVSGAEKFSDAFVRLLSSPENDVEFYSSYGEMDLFLNQH